MVFSSVDRDRLAKQPKISSGNKDKHFWKVEMLEMPRETFVYFTCRHQSGASLVEDWIYQALVNGFDVHFVFIYLFRQLSIEFRQHMNLRRSHGLQAAEDAQERGTHFGILDLRIVVVTLMCSPCWLSVSNRIRTCIITSSMTQLLKGHRIHLVYKEFSNPWDHLIRTNESEQTLLPLQTCSTIRPQNRYSH